MICGPSGSGKSSLAFETLFAEGQRQYTETLSNYVRQFIQESSKPDVDKIKNIPPPILLGQRNNIRSSRSIVGTHSEVLDHLRLIFSKVGQIKCPKHDVFLKKHSPDQGAKEIHQKFQKGFLLFPIEKVPKSKKVAIQKQLLQEGFTRIAVWNKKKLDVHLLESQTLIPNSFYVVVDRLEFSNIHRISDSMAGCYKGSKQYNPHFKSGQALAYDLSGKCLYFSSRPACPICRYEFLLPLWPSLFNFNSILGACSACKGFGNILSIDEEKVIPDPTLSVHQGAIAIFTTPSTAFERRTLYAFCKENNINLHTPWEKLTKKDRSSIWDGNAHFIGISGFFKMLESKKYKMHVRIFLSRHQSPIPCSVCKGDRTRKELKQILFQNKSLNEWTRFHFFELEKQLHSLTLSSQEAQTIKEPLKALKRKVQLINRIGLGYLSLNRLTKTLSGGELQRLNLAGQLGIGLSQILYILDEPTVGLHSQDSQKLITLLKQLQNIGNTIVVIEHDPDVIRQAQHIIEVGPGSGYKGGEVIFSGSQRQFFQCRKSITASALMDKKTMLAGHLPLDNKNFKSFLTVNGCHAHNLKNINVQIPFNRLSVCSGVSGSGKTSLVVHTLYPILSAKTSPMKRRMAFPVADVKGYEKVKKVLLMDQSPVEKTKRSFVATYMKFYTPIREMMASVLMSQQRGFRAGSFSLNVDGGRCSECQGLGYQEVEMVFMDPIRLTCESCKGLCFQSDILDIQFKNKNIYQILQMTVTQAMNFFVSYSHIFNPLSVLKKVGLDYLTLGQSLSTLSGGESQRLKLARELTAPVVQNTFYILDEPSTGLHVREIDLLIKILKDLVQKGATVLLVEHNLQVISACDYVIDLGPVAGDNGGYVVAQDFLSNFIKNKNNQGATALCLRKYLNV